MFTSSLSTCLPMAPPLCSSPITFSPNRVVVGFLGTIFANIKVLQNSNVETFITFRSSTPLILSLCDYAFLGRAWPNTRSWSCLTVLLMGSVGYVMFDSGFKVSAYLWLVTWYIFFTVDSVGGKWGAST